MKKCKICGSTCRIMGNGQYKCSSCGNFFSEDDFIDMKERVMMEAAKIKALEEA